MTDSENSRPPSGFLPGAQIEPILRASNGKTVRDKLVEILRMTRIGPHGPFRNAAIIELGPHIAENRHLLVPFGFGTTKQGRSVWFDGAKRPIFSIGRSGRTEIEGPSRRLPNFDSEFVRYNSPHHIPDRSWARIVEEIHDHRLLDELEHRFALAEDASKLGVRWPALWRRGD